MTAVLIAALKATASQWRLLLLIAAVAAAGMALHAFGAAEYRRGKAEVQQKWDLSNAAATAKAAAQARSDAQKAHDASQSYQQDSQNEKIVYRTIRQTVVRTVPARQCIDDDGLRIINAAIRGELPASAASR